MSSPNQGALKYMRVLAEEAFIEGYKACLVAIDPQYEEQWDEIDEASAELEYQKWWQGRD